MQGDPSKVKDRNLIRTSITQFFVDRGCFTLKRPVNDEKLLQHLQEAKEEDFRPQFMEELHQFLEIVFTAAKPKKLYREPLNGASECSRQIGLLWNIPTNTFPFPAAVFVHLAKNYIQAINDGSVPVIRTAWENVVEVENQKAIAEAFAIYQENFEGNFKDGAVLETQQLEAAHNGSMEKANERFLQMVKGDNHAPYERKLLVSFSFRLVFFLFSFFLFFSSFFQALKGPFFQIETSERRPSAKTRGERPKLAEAV